ncbi:MAG: GDP-mannose 4,6-dehydratase [bacterium]|nr:GDP-mannose 4,6-dehydratase [bacterium]
MTKSALITGITGQDGSYLTEVLLEKGYTVHGLVQRSANYQYENIEHLLPDIHVITGDLADFSSLVRAVKQSAPDEIYNLAAQSFVKASWDIPELTGDITGVGVCRMLEAMHLEAPEARFYQASSSEMFGKVLETPQNENTPFYPRSPYGVSKAYGHYATVNYRESFNLYACSGILFNHESPRRGREFVTRKIAIGVSRIKKGLDTQLKMGNIDAKRDWGFAGDYVVAMWKMLQQETPEDFVVGTGETHSVKEFLELAFGHVGLNWQDYVVEDSEFMRPTEVDLLLSDPSKAKEKLDWTPKVSFPDLVAMMVDSEMKA